MEIESDIKTSQPADPKAGIEQIMVGLTAFDGTPVTDHDIQEALADLFGSEVPHEEVGDWEWNLQLTREQVEQLGQPDSEGVYHLSGSEYELVAGDLFGDAEDHCGTNGCLPCGDKLPLRWESQAGTSDPLVPPSIPQSSGSES